MKNAKSLLAKLWTGFILLFVGVGFSIGLVDNIYFYATNKSFTLGPTMKAIEWLYKLLIG